jgi:cytidylate kinase
MAVVTISRQIGSGGDEVARQVADRLSYRLVEREVINRAALQAGAPEVALAMIDELHLLGLSPSCEDCQAYIDAARLVMDDLAAGGNVVVVGRAGQVVLAGRPGVLHASIIAPAGLRAARLAQQRSISLQAAQAQVNASDRYRRNFLKRFYNARWDDPQWYDLVISTSRLTIDDAVGLICQALLQRFSTPSSMPGC